MYSNKSTNLMNGKRLLALCIGILWILSFSPCTGSVGLAFAKDRALKEKAGERWELLNRAGRVIGSVGTDGRILNRYGKQLGSVESDGTILNMQNRPIGKVDAAGQIFNQSGTLLGTVDAEGNVFNRTGRKVGSVKDARSLFLAGGAARMLLL